MTGLLISLLPRRARTYVEAGAVLFGALDSQAERDAALDYIREMGRNGEVTVPQWAHLGGRVLKILGKRQIKI